MRLMFSPGSPYARKYRVLLREKGLTRRVSEGDYKGFDLRKDAADTQGLRPVLVDDKSQSWGENAHIVRLLDAVGSGPKIVPIDDGEKSQRVLWLEFMADGAMDLSVNILSGQAQMTDEDGLYWLERWRTGILNGMKAAEAQFDGRAEPLDIGKIALVCTLTWLDQHHPKLDWKSSMPKLAALQKALEQRPSFRETKA